MKILILDTTFLIDVQRMVKTNGREKARLMLKKLLKQVKSVEAIWIPKTVEREFAIKDKEKKYREFLFSDISRFLNNLGISLKRCPIYSKNEITKIIENYPNMHGGEADAIHQALLMHSYEKYKMFEGVIVSNDSKALYVCRLFGIETICITAAELM